MSIYWQWAKANPDAAARKIRELERENTALRAYADKLADGLPCLPKDVENLRKANLELARENAELRAYKERLDYLERNGNLLRLTVDAARKEKQL